MEAEDGADLCFPQLLNTSCKKPTIPWFETVVIQTVLSSFSLFITALNLLVLISVSHFRQLHTPTNIFLLSLAVSDFLVGLVLIPGEIVRATSCWFLGDVVCSMCTYLTYIITTTSIGNVVLISIDRYVAICDPLHYPTRITVRRAEVFVCLCWLYSVFYISIIKKDDLAQPGRKHSCYGECAISIDYIMTDVVFMFIVPVSIIVVLYMRVFVVAVSQARAMRSHVTAVTLKLSTTPKTKKSELKAARTLGVLVVVFLICLCPYYCVFLADYSLFNTSAGLFVMYLFFINSCLNPVIYALFYSWFRKTVKLIVTLQILQPGSCEANVL